MTDLETLMANCGLPGMQAAAGQTVTYEGSEITAVVFDATGRPAFDEDDSEDVERREMIVATADVAAPALGHEVAIGDKQYAVVEVLSSNGACSRLALLRQYRKRIGTPGATIRPAGP